jgi:hypothetical protein
VIVEYLGHCWSIGPNGRTLHRTYVLWLGVPSTDMLAALRGLLTSGWRCPECTAVWPLDRRHGAIECVTPHASVRKVSDTCRHCQTIVHWDTSNAEDRAALTWVDLYERDVRYDGDRFVRHPRPVVAVEA